MGPGPVPPQPPAHPGSDHGLHQCFDGFLNKRLFPRSFGRHSTLVLNPGCCWLLPDGVCPTGSWGEGARAGAFFLPKPLPMGCGAHADPSLLLPLQPTCTSARRCGRAAGCASRLTRASSAAGACRSGAAPCASTAWPLRTAGCTPAAGTAAAPTPRSPRYLGMGGWWCPVLRDGNGDADGAFQGQLTAARSTQCLILECFLSPFSFPRLKSSLHHPHALGFLAHFQNSNPSCT